MLVQLAGKYGSKITVRANGRSASAGSVLELMNLGAAGGTVLTVTAEGNDSAEALRAVREFMQQNLQK